MIDLFNNKLPYNFRDIYILIVNFIFMLHGEAIIFRAVLQNKLWLLFNTVWKDEVVELSLVSFMVRLRYIWHPDLTSKK